MTFNDRIDGITDSASR